MFYANFFMNMLYISLIKLSFVFMKESLIFYLNILTETEKYLGNIQN